MTYRLCSTHGVPLVVKALPYSQGVAYGLCCPVEGCEYTRALKAPQGARKANRKTTRKQVKP
jgi:hypothetical protein